MGLTSQTDTGSGLTRLSQYVIFSIYETRLRNEDVRRLAYIVSWLLELYR